MLTGAGWQNCGAPGNGGCQGRYLYLSGGLDWLVGGLSWVSLLGLFRDVISFAIPLSSVHCCKPNSHPVEAILFLISGDPFVEIICEQKMVVDTFSLELAFWNEAEYSWEYWRWQWLSAEWRPHMCILFIMNSGAAPHLWSRKAQLGTRDHNYTHPAYLCYMFEFIL
jgi:hypothetical protein